MPSRAVLRRKAKKEKASTAKQTLTTDRPSVVVVSPKEKPVAVQPLLSNPPRPQTQARPRDVAVPRPPPVRVEEDANEKEASTAPEQVDLTKMSRKERHKHLLRQRLERQIARLNKAAPVEAATPATAAAAAEGENLSQDAAHVSEAKLTLVRHDPKFVNGTFWRDRKEKKKRTLFVGNLPARSFHKASSVIELIRSVVESSDEAGKIDCTNLVEHVDFLGQKLGSIVHHSYVVFNSIAAAEIAQRLLDGLPVEGQKLRVNFSADKQMRSIAIKKRSGDR